MVDYASYDKYVENLCGKNLEAIVNEFDKHQIASARALGLPVSHRPSVKQTDVARLYDLANAYPSVLKDLKTKFDSANVSHRVVTQARDNASRRAYLLRHGHLRPIPMLPLHLRHHPHLAHLRAHAPPMPYEDSDDGTDTSWSETQSDLGSVATERSDRTYSTLGTDDEGHFQDWRRTRPGWRHGGPHFQTIREQRGDYVRNQWQNLRDELNSADAEESAGGSAERERIARERQRAGVVTYNADTWASLRAGGMLDRVEGGAHHLERHETHTHPLQGGGGRPVEHSHLRAQRREDRDEL